MNYLSLQPIQYENVRYETNKIKPALADATINHSR